MRLNDAIKGGLRAALWDALVGSRYLLTPCMSSMVLWYADKWAVAGSVLKDKSTAKTHQALPAGSVEFRGAQYATVDLTDYEYEDEEVHELGFSFYTSVAIDASTAGQQAIRVDVGAELGIVFGDSTGALLNEIITVKSNAAAFGRAAYTSATANIPIGKHSCKISWNSGTTGYDIYLDDVKVNNAVANTQSVLTLSKLEIGANSGTFYLDNTNLFKIYAKNEAGTTIWQNNMSYGEDANIISTVGPDATLVNGLTSDRVESSLFGDDSFNDDGWSEGVTTNVEGYGGVNSSGINIDVDGNLYTSTAAGATNDHRVRFIATSGDNNRLVLNCTVAGTAQIYNGAAYEPVTLVVGLNTFYDIDTPSVDVYIKLTSLGVQIDVSDTSIQNIPQGKIPAKIYEDIPDGVELNGDPSNTGGFWDLAGGSTVSNGLINIYTTGAYSAIYRGNYAVVGETYQYIYTVTANRGGRLATDATASIPGTVGTHIHTEVATGATLNIKRSGVELTDIDISSLSVQKIIQSPIPNPTQDIYGNALTYPGRASKDANVYGWTIPWNGVAYVTLDEAVTMSGDFGFIVDVSDYSLASQGFLGGATLTEGGFLTASTGSIYRVYINNVLTSFLGVETPVSGGNYIITFGRISDQGTLTVLNKDTGVETSQSTTVETNDFIIRYIGLSSSLYLQSPMHSVKLYNASNQLVNHWPIEGRNNVDDEQITLYDVVGGNHATVVSGTVPLFTSPFGGDGGSYVENLFIYNDQLSKSAWITTFSGVKDSDTLVTFGSQYSQVYQNIATVEGLTYTYTLKLRNVDGNTTLAMGHPLSPDGDRTAITITSESEYYTVTFRGLVGDGNMFVGLQDNNASGRGQVEILEAHLTVSDGNYIRTDATAIPLTLIPSGGSYLAEKGGRQAENLLKRSQQFSYAGSAWSSATCTPTFDIINGPDGTLSGTLIEYLQDYGNITQPITLTVDSPLTFSVYLKAFSDDGSQLLVYNTTQTAQVKVNSISDITTGVSVGDDWYRHELSIINTDGIGYSVGDILTFYIYPSSGHGLTVDSGCYIWGAQVNQGSDVLDYIQTEATAIPLSIIPYGGSTESNTFDGVFDAPADVFQVEQVEATLAAYNADQTLFARDPELWDDDSTTEQTGWTDVGGGVYSCDGSQTDYSSVYIGSTVIIGKWYEVTFTLSNRAAGTVGLFPGFSASASERSVDGTYTESVLGSGNDELKLRGTIDFVGTVSNISVKEMTANDTFYNADGTLKLVDPSTIETKGDTQFIGNKAVTVYSANIEGSCLNKTNKYHGL